MSRGRLAAERRVILKSRLELFGGPHDGESVVCPAPTPPEPFVVPDLDGLGRPDALYRRVRRVRVEGLTGVWRYEWDARGVNPHRRP